MTVRAPVIALAALLLAGCGGAPQRGVELTLSGSTLGDEGKLLAHEVARFEALHPDIHVRVQPTPDDATQRHQLYVQWLNARAGDPDVLQLDVVWTAEFAAAGWIAPLDRFHPDTAAFFPNVLSADRWAHHLYALPWYVDVGMLYWRTDLVPHAPRSFRELTAEVRLGRARGGAAVPYGFVWQGARYEGLVTVFLEYLGGFGGQIMTPDGRVLVDSPAAVAALTEMRHEIGSIAPPQVLTWHEEETRFAFQNGKAVFMRNWPYAAALMRDSAQSRVAGRFAVAPMPAGPGGHPTAALGGGELAVNAFSNAPDSAYALVAFLTAPQQVLERATAAGYYPPRPALYRDPRLRGALAVPLEEARTIIEHATARPVTPIYSQLSELLQIQLHRALTGEATPSDALHTAARQMTDLLRRTGVAALMRRGIEP